MNHQMTLSIDYLVVTIDAMMVIEKTDCRLDLRADVLDEAVLIHSQRYMQVFKTDPKFGFAFD